MTRTWLLVLGASLGAGCGSKDEPGAPAKAKAGSGSAGAVAPTTAGSGSGSATASGSGSGSGAPTKAPVAKLAKADVEAVLAAWLAAQTSGTYDAYAQLYADKFEGVRRSGPRVRRFDRAGWLADRKRMFAKPMTVSTSAPAISMAGAMATVDVVQTFAQGTFKDVGPKRLIVVATAAGAKIAREEMLASELVRDAAKPDDNIYLVTDIGNEELVLLGGGDRTWGAGPVSRFTSTTDPFLSIQAASKLPPEQAAWTGKRLRGYATDGTSCEITLGALKLVAGGTPHFGTVQLWDDGAENGLGRPYTEQERVDSMFEVSTPQLGATFTGDCQPDFLFAGTPTFLAEASLDDAARAKAAAAFKQLPDWATIQQDFLSYEGSTGEWAAAPTLHAWTAPGGDLIVLATASEGNGCGEFSGELYGAWRVHGGAWKLIDSATTYVAPTAMLDLEGDGGFEIFEVARPGFGTHQSMWSLGGGNADAGIDRVAVEYLYGDCGC